MYCPECNKDGIDFNSVAVTTARPSYTGEIGDTGVYGTVHNSNTNIINVCKECGCDDLYRTRHSYFSYLKKERTRKRKNKAILINLGFVAGLVAVSVGSWLLFHYGVLNAEWAVKCFVLSYFAVLIKALDKAYWVGMIGTLLFGTLLIGVILYGCQLAFSY